MIYTVLMTTRECMTPGTPPEQELGGKFLLGACIIFIFKKC